MNFFWALIIIAVAVTAVKAEVDCNQHPPHVNPINCCELSDALSEEIKEICALQHDDFGFHRGHPHGRPGHHHGPPGHRGGSPKFEHHSPCFLSCVVNKTGILVDGEYQPANVTSYLNELFGDSEKVEFLSNKFMFCNEKHKNVESMWPEHRHDPPHCPFKQNGMLMVCVSMDAFKDCPSSFWSNTDECNEVRQHFIQCWDSKEEGDEENMEIEEEEVEDI